MYVATINMQVDILFHLLCTVELRLTNAGDEGISSKARAAYTVKGPISQVSTDAFSIYTACGKVTRICTQNITFNSIYVAYAFEQKICKQECK